MRLASEASEEPTADRVVFLAMWSSVLVLALLMAIDPG
jgi:hypothetical protein